ncbi:M50 family metallopeptidase [Embleya sp. NPDC050493]|uniref:M50 family metallopeptidase n=1 Tax=Embleya sp. NPDC050493 TaxID=3363989 RepID=UPI0037B7D529
MTSSFSRLLWEHAFATQPHPPPGLVLVAGGVALTCVVHRLAWSTVRCYSVMAHEAGHVLAALLCGHRVVAVRLEVDNSGTTSHRGKGRLRRLLIAAAGYPAPSLAGVGGAALLRAGHVTASLWAVTALMLLLLTTIRNVFGVVIILLASGVLVAVSWRGRVEVQAFAAYVVVWFLLIAAVRHVVELLRRHLRGNSSSDAATLATSTGIPWPVWVAAFGLMSIAMAWLGAGWLLDDGDVSTAWNPPPLPRW